MANVVRVFDLVKGEYVADYVGISPKNALIAAYAQFKKKDFNTWDYEKRYGHLVEEGPKTFLLGDFTVLKG